MKSPHELKSLFYEPGFIGEVLRYATLLECELDTLLSLYFCRKERVKIALERLMPELSLHAKIEMLSAIPIRKTTRSYATAISRLRAFRRLRNLVAHQWTVSVTEIEALCKNNDIAAMLHGYPASMNKEFRSCRHAVERLTQTREFRLEDGTHLNSSGRFSLIMDKVFD
jgi:hypothetical protein